MILNESMFRYFHSKIINEKCYVVKTIAKWWNAKRVILSCAKFVCFSQSFHEWKKFDFILCVFFSYWKSDSLNLYFSQTGSRKIRSQCCSCVQTMALTRFATWTDSIWKLFLHPSLMGNSVNRYFCPNLWMVRQKKSNKW